MMLFTHIKRAIWATTLKLQFEAVSKPLRYASDATDNPLRRLVP